MTWSHRFGLLFVGLLAAPVAGWGQTPPDAAAQLGTLYTRLMTPGARLSVSESLAELDAIEPQTAPGSVDRGREEHLRGLIEYKAQRPEPSILHFADALKIDAATPFLSPSDRVMANYHAATQAQALGKCGTALPYYEAAAGLLAADPSQTEANRLGVQVSLAYCLHETGRYADAQRVNQAVLAGGERLYGPNDPKLMPVLINLAQNDYELHQPAEARALLQRVLAIGTASGDAGRVDTALFQLGVLAYEGGSPAEARGYMTRRLQLARESGDADRSSGPSRICKRWEDKVSAR